MNCWKICLTLLIWCRQTSSCLQFLNTGWKAFKEKRRHHSSWEYLFWGASKKYKQKSYDWTKCLVVWVVYVEKLKCFYIYKYILKKHTTVANKMSTLNHLVDNLNDSRKLETIIILHKYNNLLLNFKCSFIQPCITKIICKNCGEEFLGHIDRCYKEHLKYVRTGKLDMAQRSL